MLGVLSDEFADHKSSLDRLDSVVCFCVFVACRSMPMSIASCQSELGRTRVCVDNRENGMCFANFVDPVDERRMSCSLACWPSKPSLLT